MREFYSKYQDYFPAAFFVSGFVFDLLTTDRIDQGFSLIQQAVYLAFLLLFVYWEIVTPAVFLKQEGLLAKIWTWHIELLHFLFGSLLSLYTIFYFKSASLVTSFLFMLFLALVLVVNELPRFQKRGIVVRSILLALCLSSYFVYLVPVMIGNIGVLSFVVAMAMSAALFGLLCLRINRSKQESHWVKQNVMFPGFVIQLIFVLLYFFKALPPVPISLKYIGIYHQVEKHEGDYLLKYQRSWWRFWELGAQTFVRQDGDRLHCFVSIFSPTSFSDQMSLVWYHDSGQGWEKRDVIALSITGGRGGGYRGHVYKSNFEKGSWQIRVLTSDLREVGRISLEVIDDKEAATPRQWRLDRY